MTTSNTDGRDYARNDDDNGDYADDDKCDGDTYDRTENENSTKKTVRIITVEGGNDVSHHNPPDPTNLRDHYTYAHCLAFHSRFFGKKNWGNEVYKSREERDIIFDVVKKLNKFKDKEKEGELTDNDEKDFLKRCQSNHAAYDWMKKYTTYSITLPNGSVKNIFHRLEIDKEGVNGDKFSKKGNKCLRWTSCCWP